MGPNSAAVFRRSSRVRVRIPVTIEGELPDGTPFTEETYVVSVSKFGAKLETNFPLEPGAEIRLRSKARPDEAFFQVVWLIRNDMGSPCQAGIQYVRVSNFLGIAFPE